jgi:hypothetical protein
MKEYRPVDVTLHAFLSSAFVEGQILASRFGPINLLPGGRSGIGEEKKSHYSAENHHTNHS